MQQTKKQAFTLVELIVVITIIVILGTIAFISLQGYSSSARDSKRLSDIQNIKKSLELFSLNTGKYPEPDNQLIVSYDTQDLWYQGTVGDQVTTNLSRNLNKKPTDPLTDLEYTYSRTYKGNEYELLSIYESDLVSFTSLQHSSAGEAARTIVGANPVFAQASAAHANYTKIDGTYNGVFVKAGNYIIPTPSIINSEIEGEDIILDSTNITSQIITGGENNISYNGETSIIQGLEGMSLQVFTGTLDKVGEDDDLHKRDLLEILQQAYTNTSLINDGVYQEILTTSLTSIGEVIELIDNLVLGKDDYSVSGGSNTIINYSCDETTKPLENEYITYVTGTPTSENQTYIQDAENCGYICEEGTEYSVGDNACMLSECSGSIAQYATDNSTSQSYGVSWNHNLTPGVCTFACNEHYTWNDVDTCEADTQTVTCSGTQPTHSTLNSGSTYIQTWNGSEFTPTVSYNNNTSGDCSYQCSDDYTGVNCDTAPTYYPGCDTPDIIIGDYIIAGCNVGATSGSEYALCTSTDTSACTTERIGYYFQWGENVAWDNTDTVTSSNNCLWDRDTQICGSSVLSSWSSTVSDTISDGVSRWYDWSQTDNRGPCAEGYHVPTQTEWAGLVSAGDGEYWDISGTTTEGTDMQTALKLPYAGVRARSTGAISHQGGNGYYWSSSPNGTNGYYLYFTSNYIGPSSNYIRALGYSIRCFKN